MFYCSMNYIIILIFPILFLYIQTHGIGLELSLT